MRDTSVLAVLLVLLVSTLGVSFASNDYYTSLVGLHKLARVEQQIVSALNDYVTSLEARLELAKKYLTDYENSVSPVMNQLMAEDEMDKRGTTTLSVYNDEKKLQKLAEKVSAHPLMTYRLIRRYAKELVDFEKDMRRDHDKQFSRVMEKIRKGMVLPKPTDVAGAIEGLVRIQDAYDMKIDEFTKGKFVHLETNSSLLAVDCYHVGMYSFKSNVYTRAIEWLEHAYMLTENEDDDSIDSHVVYNALQEAIQKHNEVLASPDRNMYVYTAPVLSNLTDRGHRVRFLQATEHTLYLEDNSIMDFTNFAALCSGKQLREPELTKDLRCYYNNKFPEFVIDPYKVEVLHEDPTVIQVYEVLTEKTIEAIMRKAMPSLARSRVQGSSGNEKDVVSSIRTSTTTWIPERTIPRISKLPSKIQRITGLNIAQDGAAEDLQISSYGIGGHYNPHFDTLFGSTHYVAKMSPQELAMGDRIATFMFYLSDVEVGGGTAFPRLGVVASPIKGSAIFWFNALENGETHPLSLHGGCPVLYGNKWVANKWIRGSLSFKNGIQWCQLWTH